MSNCFQLFFFNLFFFFFNDTATTEIYTLSLHDALPISGGPPEVVGVGQAAGLAVAFGDAGSVRDARLEVVALLERLHADAVLRGYGVEGGHEALVHDSGLEVLGRLRRRPEARALQEPPRRGVGGFVVLFIVLLPGKIQIP